jgi:hypothetical protein
MPNNHEPYRQPTPGMLAAAALVQDWSIGVLDAVQRLHLERCAGKREVCPFDRYGYPFAIEAAGLWLRELIEAYSDEWIDAPHVAARLDPGDVAQLIFTDLDHWDQLAAERLAAHQGWRAEVLSSLALSNEKARERWRAAHPA